MEALAKRPSEIRREGRFARSNRVCEARQVVQVAEWSDTGIKGICI